jgi:hypothetical protein
MRYRCAARVVGREVMREVQDHEARNRAVRLAVLWRQRHADEAKPCDQLSELDCIHSTVCKLEQTAKHGGYICRAARGRCESGFRQAGEGDIKKLCESQPGCVFKYPECFCPPGLACECGGGPPAQCVERK